MVKFRMPKMYSIDDFLTQHPEFLSRGAVALFPNLIERDNEEKRRWLESILVEGKNGSSKPTFEFMVFCTSGDAMIVMRTEEGAKELANRSPLYKSGSEVLFQTWSDILRVKMQYRGAYNRVMEMEEVEF